MLSFSSGSWKSAIDVSRGNPFWVKDRSKDSLLGVWMAIYMSHSILPVFMSLPKFLFYKDINNNGIRGPPFDLILTNYICNNSLTSLSLRDVLSYTEYVTILKRCANIAMVLLAKMWCWHYTYIRFTQELCFLKVGLIKILLIYVLKALETMLIKLSLKILLQSLVFPLK